MPSYPVHSFRAIIEGITDKESGEFLKAELERHGHRVFIQEFKEVPSELFEHTHGGTPDYHTEISPTGRKNHFHRAFKEGKRMEDLWQESVYKFPLTEGEEKD